MRSFDAIVIGAGQAGPSLAGRFNEAGKTVAIIERKHVGGTCVNTGCKPTKTLVASAYAAHLARRAQEYGIGIGGTVTVDMPAVMQRAYKVTLDSRHGNERWLDGMPQCELIRGHARFENVNTIRVDGELLTAPQIFLNVGARATIPDFAGIGVPDAPPVGVHRVLIGGQTAAIVMGNQLINRPVYGQQRKISDIIYFATAMPEGG